MRYLLAVMKPVYIVIIRPFVLMLSLRTQMFMNVEFSMAVNGD